MTNDSFEDTVYIYIYFNESLIIVSPVRMYSGEGGILWFSRRYAAACFI